MVERVPVPPEGDRPASRAGSVASSVASRLSAKPVASSSKGELPQLEEEVFEYVRLQPPYLTFWSPNTDYSFVRDAGTRRSMAAASSTGSRSPSASTRHAW